MDKIFSWASGSNSARASLKNYSMPGGSRSAYDITILPALFDNYMYLITTRQSKAVVVDPVEADKVLAVCASLGVELIAVLTTHYHSDHSGGNARIAEKVPGVAVFAGEQDAMRTPAVTHTVVHGERFKLAGLPFRCIGTPCHTRGHVSFLLDAADEQAPALFCGDTLFVAGCGRFMEGTAADMRESLNRLGALPPSTRVFCGHEYTVNNLRFAALLEPSNPLIASRLQDAEEKRKSNLPTVPSTVAEECEHNPFLRVLEPTLTGIICPECADDPLLAVSKIRRRKDTWTPVGTLVTWGLDIGDAITKVGDWVREGPGIVCSKEPDTCNEEMLVAVEPAISNHLCTPEPFQFSDQRPRSTAGKEPDSDCKEEMLVAVAPALSNHPCTQDQQYII
mmetsp:Transcript_116906/g.225508  ORF Transcript_116906/g.225508 Transcript_116906/m.225508 type:complete len:394 (-) Transcript_116906:216-1397(-)